MELASFINLWDKLSSSHMGVGGMKERHSNNK